MGQTPGLVIGNDVYLRMDKMCTLRLGKCLPDPHRSRLRQGSECG